MDYEYVKPVPKNIYGVTKAAAEDLCQLFHRNHGLPCIVLRTSRFFPEPDLNRSVRESYADDNIKVSEYLYRRVDLEDAVSAHLLAAERAPAIGFGRYIISATTPGFPEDLPDLRRDARWERAVASPPTQQNRRAVGGEWFPPSIGCTSMSVPGTSSAGSRGMISRC